MDLVTRLVVENHLRRALLLWLDAIQRGDYAVAREIMEWRAVLRRRLGGGT